MISTKADTVESLKRLEDEVVDFHPVLNSLFRKMPGIQRCHYNQGPNEMGADFILYRNDDALLRTTQVGVVVKVGTIKQNTTEVERQIKECFVPRRAADGVDIQIREVWVVSNVEITKNARDVLMSLYSDRKIEFISGQDLATLIDKYAPDCFTTISPQLQAFADDIEASLQDADRASLVVPGMESFYIEPKITRRVMDGYGNVARTRTLSGLDELIKLLLSSQLSFIEAGAGGGKSKAAREMVRKIIGSSEFSEGRVVPLSVHAKDLYGDIKCKLTIACERAREASAATSASVMVFVDGFDEVDISPEERFDFITCLIAACSENSASAVLLSRPFDIVGTAGPKVASLDVYQIEPLQGTRAIKFLERVTKQSALSNRLMRDLGDSALMKALDGSPISYILLGRILAENEQDLPSNLTELFQKYTEIVLGRWEMSKGLRSQKEYEVLVEALTWLSRYLLDNDLPRIASSELEDWIRDYTSSRGLEMNAAVLVNRVTERSSILYQRNDNGSVGFRHRAFMEFFYARGLSKMRDVSLEPSVFSPYWANTYYFLAGMYRDCPDMIQALVDMDIDQFDLRIMRVINFGNIMLAGYLTPHGPCSAALRKVALDAADIYMDSIDPKSASPLSSLPVMQILCALVQTFSGQYGYRHFRSPLETVIFELEDGADDDRVAVALFLLDAAYKDAGGALRFDNLLEKFGERLPLPVKLAIGHESNRMGRMSDMVKKMERNLKKSFRGRPGTAVFMGQLYRTPVAKLEKKIV
ncbi:NACHT domain-containing protein [Stenotrophomonas sp. PSU-St83]